MSTVGEKTAEALRAKGFTVRLDNQEVYSRFKKIRGHSLLTDAEAEVYLFHRTEKPCGLNWIDLVISTEDKENSARISWVSTARYTVFVYPDPNYGVIKDTIKNLVAEIFPEFTVRMNGV